MTKTCFQAQQVGLDIEQENKARITLSFKLVDADVFCLHNDPLCISVEFLLFSIRKAIYLDCVASRNVVLVLNCTTSKKHTVDKMCKLLTRAGKKHAFLTEDNTPAKSVGSLTCVAFERAGNVLISNAGYIKKIPCWSACRSYRESIHQGPRTGKGSLGSVEEGGGWVGGCDGM